MGKNSNQNPAKPVPASARPLANDAGLNVDLHYSRGHIAKLKEMKKNGARINLPPGVTMDDDEPNTPAPSAPASTTADSTDRG